MRGRVDDVVDQAVLLGLCGAHREVPVRVAFNLLKGLPGVFGHNAVHALAQAKNLAGVNIDLSGLTLDSATHDEGLVDQDTCIGKSKTLSLLTGHQQKGTHGRRLTDAKGLHIILDVLHGVIDRETGRDGAARRVDVQLDVLFRVLAGEKQELRNDEIGYIVVDWRTEEDDVVAEQTAVDVVGAFAPARLLEHHRYESHCFSLSVAA